MKWKIQNFPNQNFYWPRSVNFSVVGNWEKETDQKEKSEVHQGPCQLYHRGNHKNNNLLATVEFWNGQHLWRFLPFKGEIAKILRDLNFLCFIEIHAFSPSSGRENLICFLHPSVALFSALCAVFCSIFNLRLRETKCIKKLSWKLVTRGCGVIKSYESYRIVF